MKRIFTLLFLLTMVKLCMVAVPAFPKKVKVATESGDTVEISLKGDEFNKFAISDDGLILVPRNESWYYLKRDSINYFEVSEIRIRKNLPKKIKQGLLSAESTTTYPPQKKSLKRERMVASYTGESHALIILMEYPDKKMIKHREDIEDLFNKIGYKEDRAQGSVRDFYRYASYQKFDLQSDIYGPYTAKMPMNHYGGNDGNGNDHNVLDLIIEAIESLPPDIDMAAYDNNGDGMVDNVHVIFAGYGEESGASSSAIWSHEYPNTLPIRKNGYAFAGYSCTPELRSNMGTGITRIGVICHELGHAFGANDYYDVDYSSNGSFEGTGVWDIMASGSWNNGGVSPANFNPYIKYVDFGWIDPMIPEESCHISMTASNYTPFSVLIPTNNPDDYYLLEYRSLESFDKYLPGEGLLIYHVHPQLEGKRHTNMINSGHPQCLYPVCASSNKSPFDTGDYGDINSAGCPFPGVTNKTVFSENSNPKAFQWNGVAPNFSLNDIRLINNAISLDVIIDNRQLTDDDDKIGGVAYKESFEKGLDNFSSESIEGSAIWSIYPTNSLTSLNDMPFPIEGQYAVMLYDGNKAVMPSKSILSSERIGLNSDSLYMMSFKMRTMERSPTSSHNLALSVMSADTHEWIGIYEESESVDDWREVRVSLPKNLTTIYYRLEGEVFNSGLFIDDIQIQSIASNGVDEVLFDDNSFGISTDPFCIFTKESTNVLIYDISGKTVGRYYLTPNAYIAPDLQRGTYIICTDRGFRYKVKI